MTRVLSVLCRTAVRIAIFLTMTGCGLALDPSQALSIYLRTAFTVEDGLPSNIINGIAQSSDGFLWIATGGGLVRFDGRHFLPVKLVPAVGEISAVVTGPDGDLWLGSQGGVVRVPRRYLDQTGPIPTISYSPGIRIALLHFAHDGVLWAGSTGLYRLTGQEFSLVIPSLNISRIEETRNGHLFLTTAQGVVEWDGIRAVEHPEIARKYGGPKSEIYDVYQDRSGAMWFCGGAGLVRVIAERVDWFAPPDKGGGPLAAYRIFEDKSGSIWVSMTGGIHRLTAEILDPLSPRTGGRAIFEDRDGNMWFGTNGAGLIRLRNRLVRIFTQADGLWNDVVSTVFTTRDGTLWVGENIATGGKCGGLARFDGQRFHTYEDTNGLTNTCVTSLAQDTKGDLWVGTYNGGVFRFRDGKFTQYSEAQGLASSAVLEVLAARDGSVWLVTLAGLSRMQGGKFRSYTIHDGLSELTTLSVYQDRTGTVWAGSVHTLDRLQGERFVNVARLNEASYIRVAGGDRLGNLYVSCGSKGVARLVGGRLTALVPEIAGFQMVAVQRDLWFTGRFGIQRVNSDQLRNWNPQRDGPLDYVTFGLADGLKSMETGSGVPNITATPDRKVWVATRNGLAMVDTIHLPQSTAKPMTYVEQITIDRRKQSPGSELVLPPGSHRVELDFDTIELTSPERTRIQYRLDGVDNEWVDAETTRTALYQDIPLGRHKFRVRATNRDGVWDREGIAYWITQEPHYYETNLFRVALVASGLLLVVAFYQLRLRQAAARLNAQLEGRLTERERIAHELHDTLLQSFQGVMLRFQTVDDLLPARPAAAKQQLEKALERADHAIAEGREAIQDIRSSTVVGNDLAQAMTALGDELGSLDSAEFRVMVEGPPRNLQPVLRDEIYCITREAMRNAFRHAHAHRIEAEITYGEKLLRLRIRDDGRGMDPAIAQEGRADHYGLPGMRERAKRIGAQLSVWSGAGQGTEIELSVPGKIAYRTSRRRTRFRLFPGSFGENS